MTPSFRRTRPPLAAGRGTVALGVLAGGAVVAVWGIELARVWRRGSAPRLPEAERPLDAAELAVAETAEVARVGYRAGSTRENAMFNLVTSFAATSFCARGITYLLRRRRTVGPFRPLLVGERHIHHFVPGIVIAFASGAGAILTRKESIEPKLAITYGIGLGLTLDESAMLLELDDVYWSREGLLSVQITLAVMATLASAALGLRFLRRGERAVLVDGTA